VTTAVDPDGMQDGWHEEVTKPVSPLKKWSFVGGMQVISGSWMRSDGECISTAVIVADMVQFNSILV
jgi:hypothetical protein